MAMVYTDQPTCRGLAPPYPAVVEEITEPAPYGCVFCVSVVRGPFSSRLEGVLHGCQSKMAPVVSSTARQISSVVVSDNDLRPVVEAARSSSRFLQRGKLTFRR